MHTFSEFGASLNSLVAASGLSVWGGGARVSVRNPPHHASSMVAGVLIFLYRSSGDPRTARSCPPARGRGLRRWQRDKPTLARNFDSGGRFIIILKGGAGLEHLGLLWGHLGIAWSHLGPSWSHLGPSWSHLWSSWSHLGPSWSQLEPSRSQLEPSWSQLEPSWSQIEPS